jgi:hypothetical protein
VGKREVKGGAPAHRVPGPERSAWYQVRQQFGRRPQVGYHVGGPTMPRSVRQYEGRPPGQGVYYRRPRRSGLGETVQQHQGARGASGATVTSGAGPGARTRTQGMLGAVDETSG